MKLLSYAFTLLFLLTTHVISAQQEVSVTGVVMDQDVNQPLEYATIAFFSKSENRIVTGGITDLDGKFDIKVPKGTYDISVEYISYSTKTIPNKTINRDTNLGVMGIAIDAQSLGEVSIIAERTTVEIKLDKKIYNVGQDLTVRGGTVSDVLDNVPSVSVDVEGNVSLRGNENVTILINGKPSGLVGLNSTDALRQLPAESIERVEVITSPSARYDAEGTAGILNIILRRSKLQGLNGAITANAGHPTTAGISGNINYRTGDFNFFNTTGYSYRESPGKSFTETQYFNRQFDEDGNLIADNPDTFLNEDRETDRQNKNFTTNIGLEWYITDSASLTTSVVYRGSDEENSTSNFIKEFNAVGDILNESTRFDPELEDDKTIQYSVNYDKQFGGNSQHKLTFDFQYETSDENERSIISQDGDATERVETLQSQNEILLQSDYVLPLGENSQFEFGYRGNFNELDTDYSLEFNDNGEFVLDTDVSNNLIYREYINAVYSQFGSKIKSKFSYLLGLRMESARLTIDQLTSNDFQKKNYTDLFPTVNLGYEINEKQSLQLGYNRRIRRPRSRFINPFPSRSSATNLFQGNPDINPSYSNKVDLGYLNRFGKFTLNSSIYYERATDVFTFISEDTGDVAIINGTEFPIIRRTPINLATNDRYGFEFTVSYRPSKVWNINGNFNLFQSNTEGFYNGFDYGAENLSWFARLNNKYTLPGSIDWQTRVFYMGPSEDAQNKRKGMFSTDMAFSKDLFDDRASLAFNVSDLFNTRKRSMESTTPTFNSNAEFQWRQRSFNVSFTYRFNQQKKQQRDMERGNGGDDMDFEG
ncbi:outer membrane receptor protein involved in Fe transport [Gelidibacter sediminis]|uniref:Outer membrane receptor protein involved in Fe transport n=1 Tax=Gelidibacter sediminis TaxID=1608710 RepID=A0A4R7Q0F3_9FLAO|nr:TonB-dependent receptor [Gelidibacter sediminis]TDU39931.1 outer membrane receptor protein involved in Fe transport [Gelidibacter sediminis]